MQPFAPCAEVYLWPCQKFTEAAGGGVLQKGVLAILSILIKFWRPAFFLKRDFNTGVLQRNLRNFKEHLF